MFNFKKYNWKKYNVSLVVMVILLCLISSYAVKCAGGETLGAYFFQHQLMGLGLGLLVVGVVSILDYHFICRFAVVYYLFGTLLVAATRFSPLGTDHGTTQFRWIAIGGMDFQPSELVKIIIVISLSTYFAQMKDRLDKWYTIPLAIVLTALPTGFVLVQSDLSSSLVLMFIFGILIFASGISYKILLPIIGVMIPLGLALFWYIQQPYQVLLNEYQLDRVNSFIHPEEHSLDGMYQQNNSVDAIAAGGVYGKLLKDETDGFRGYEYVGVNESDFVFSVIGEEFGFIGSCMILGLLALVIIKCLVIAKKASDYIGMLIAIGIAAMFMFQIFANIGVATSILPNTGLPLPFLSYGLSSMLSSMIGIGLVLNIGLQGEVKEKDDFSLYEL